MTHHPHVHMIVPGGGLSADKGSWVACRKGFFLPVRALSKLFRRLMLEKLVSAHEAGELAFFGAHAQLADGTAFKRLLRPLRRHKWFVYAKRPFAGPKAVLAYLSRYTHPLPGSGLPANHERGVAISNSRLIRADENDITFRVKNYRVDGDNRYTVMTLGAHEFIRRILIHVLPKGLHRIRHYGLFASGVKAENLARMRALLEADGATTEADDSTDRQPEAPEERNALPCPCCGSAMRVIEVFEPGQQPRWQPTPAGIDSS